jgi:hypothetical protein
MSKQRIKNFWEIYLKINEKYIHTLWLLYNVYNFGKQNFIFLLSFVIFNTIYPFLLLNIEIFNIYFFKFRSLTFYYQFLRS